jgi:hypothetical protein
MKSRHPVFEEPQRRGESDSAAGRAGSRQYARFETEGSFEDTSGSLTPPPSRCIWSRFALEPPIVCCHRKLRFGERCAARHAVRSPLLDTLLEPIGVRPQAASFWQQRPLLSRWRANGGIGCKVSSLQRVRADRVLAHADCTGTCIATRGACAFNTIRPSCPKARRPRPGVTT